ncbi:MAG: addiction module antidote protein [Allosphingosinicella sp.]
MTIEARPFDAAAYLDTAGDQASLLSDAIDSGDHRYIAYALGAVARARGGIAKLAKEAGLSRQALHTALSENGNPTLETVIKVVKALGLEMRIEEPGKREAA